MENSKISSIQAYSTSRKFLNKLLMSGCVLRLHPPTPDTVCHAFICVHPCVSTFVCVRLCSSAFTRVRPRSSAFVCMRLCASTCVFVSPCVSASRAVHIILNFLPIMLFRNSSKDYLTLHLPIMLELNPIMLVKNNLETLKQ